MMFKRNGFLNRKSVVGANSKAIKNESVYDGDEPYKVWAVTPNDEYSGGCVIVGAYNANDALRFAKKEVSIIKNWNTPEEIDGVESEWDGILGEYIYAE